MKRGARAEPGLIDRGNLFGKLSLLKAALSANVTAEQAGYLTISGNYISAFDGEVGVHVHVPEVLPKTAVDAKIFIALMKRGGEPMVDMVLDAPILTVTCGRVKAQLPTKDLRDPHPIEEVGELDWYDLPKGFMKALEVCSIACAKDITQGIMTCVRAKGSQMTGCDSYRMAVCEMEEEMPEDMVLYFPSSKIPAISKMEPTCLAVDGSGYIHLMNAEADYITVSSMSGNYPNIERVIENAGEGDEIQLPAGALYSALGRAEIFGQESGVGKQAELTIGSKSLTIKAGSSSGKMSETLRCGWEGKQKQFLVYVHHLKDILSFGVDGMMVESERLLRFDSDGLTWVVCKATPINPKVERSVRKEEEDEDVPF